MGLQLLFPRCQIFPKRSLIKLIAWLQEGIGVNEAAATKASQKAGQAAGKAAQKAGTVSTTTSTGTTY